MLRPQDEEVLDPKNASLKPQINELGDGVGKGRGA